MTATLWEGIDDGVDPINVSGHTEKLMQEFLPVAKIERGGWVQDGTSTQSS